MISYAYVFAGIEYVYQRLVRKESAEQRAYVDVLAIAAQKNGVLYGGVCVAYHGYVLARVECAVAERTVAYTVAYELLFALDSYMAGLYAR